MHEAELLPALRNISNLKNITSSAQTINRKKNMLEKLTPRIGIILLTEEADFSHPPILLFEESLINQAIQLYESYAE